MNRPLTKYLLFIPLSYIGYCYYEYLRERTQKEELASRNGDTQSLNYQYARFRKCKTTVELGNIFKKSVKYVRMNITEPYNVNPEIVDCKVIDFGESSGQWWSFPYRTETTLKANQYNIFKCQKDGFYSLLFWTGLNSREQLLLSNTGNDEDIIEQMINKREDKCHQIVKIGSPTSNIEYERQFVECMRKTEGVSRMLEKEFNRINLMKSYRYEM